MFSAAQELNERSHFTLLDEQRLAFELVLHAVERTRAVDRKSVVVVSGGPGSGKSVIALSVLGELARHALSPQMPSCPGRAFVPQCNGC